MRQSPPTLRDLGARRCLVRRILYQADHTQLHYAVLHLGVRSALAAIKFEQLPNHRPQIAKIDFVY